MISLEDFLDKMPRPTQEAVIPEPTASYQPVPNRALGTFIYKSLDQAGIEITDVKYGFGRNGNQLVGTATLAKGNDYFNQSVVFRNSYDKSMSVGIGSGSGTVLVCTNGVISADVVAVQKHTVNVAKVITKIMYSQLESLDANFSRNEEALEIMKQTQLTKSTAYEIVGNLFIEQKVLTTTQINLIRKEMYSSENFKMLGSGGDMSMYNLFNNVTESLKLSRPSTYTKDHVAAFETCLKYSGYDNI